MPRTFVWHPSKGPKTTEKSTLTDGKVEIKQLRSGIGKTERMKATLEAMGLRGPNSVVVHKDSPALRGQIRRVRHLISVTPISEA